VPDVVIISDEVIVPNAVLTFDEVIVVPMCDGAAVAPPGMEEREPPLLVRDCRAAAKVRHSTVVKSAVKDSRGCYSADLGRNPPSIVGILHVIYLTSVLDSSYEIRKHPSLEKAAAIAKKDKACDCGNAERYG
ncbi:hypothetical protein RYX36_014319, partial [Vicia faba]